ncbi:MAG: CoB--CoM heterodisulfide reductase iron-sulfur subunit B family protein [Candidatus Bathyarchaeia archaeon]
MEYTYFMGCQIPARLNNCDLSIRNAAETLGIEMSDLEGAGCCGYPLRSLDSKATVLMASRNIALADKMHRDVMVVCNSCYSTLTEVKNLLKEEPKLLEEANEALGREGLHYEGTTRIKHILQVLYHNCGINKIDAQIKRRFEGLNVAVHYGCHILRPSENLSFDDPEIPHILDELVEMTGAKSVYWPLKLWCCGATTLPFDEKLGMKLIDMKLKDARNAGAHCMVTTCPSCQISFDILQPRTARIHGEQYNIPVLYYPQLLGLALGLSPKEVGLGMNRVSAEPILQFLRET